MDWPPDTSPRIFFQEPVSEGTTFWDLPPAASLGQDKVPKLSRPKTHSLRGLNHFRLNSSSNPSSCFTHFLDFPTDRRRSSPRIVASVRGLAMAYHRCDGSVETWGFRDSGGDSSRVAPMLGSAAGVLCGWRILHRSADLCG